MLGRKIVSSASQKDIWHAVEEGSLADVDTALALMKKNGVNINARSVFGLTPLHIATWRNHIPIVKRLLAAGADSDARVCHFAQWITLLLIYLKGNV
jgi:ankyrin repeat protein